ncbi:uncharacterized protein LOC142741808 [Rhinoderma darwinii]|uniref:uncharacterized protein LOC142741808 n=1 Tax=Rhinoderma darwinii TaxID=43563 RepID=UPI003F66E93E
MERIRNQIRLLQVCLLLWIGITVSVAQVTIEESSTGPTGSSPMANTDWPGDTAQATQTQGHEAKCHLFNCMGEHCYANESLPENSANGTCTTYCALYRHNSSFYESKCDEHCNHHLCNESAPDGCTMRCCNSKECTMSPNTRNNGTLDNSTAMSSTAVMSTPASTMSSTTTTTIVYSDKKCRSFKCDGTDCYKTASQTIQCQVGINHCEDPENEEPACNKGSSDVFNVWTDRLYPQEKAAVESCVFLSALLLNLATALLMESLTSCHIRTKSRWTMLAAGTSEGTEIELRELQELREDDEDPHLENLECPDCQLRAEDRERRQDQCLRHPKNLRQLQTGLREVAPEEERGQLCYFVFK